MKGSRHILRDGYHGTIWNRFPELVLSLYLVNTSFDSGYLPLSDSMKQDGWHSVGKLAHSPQIRSTQQIPMEQYDEWLIFDHPIQVSSFETMVNFCGFSPIDFDWVEKRDRFWEQIILWKPLHVIAENARVVYLLSKDTNLIRKVQEAEEKS
jgi:hypothetical protein